MAGPFKARTIREENQFSEEKKRLGKTAKRLDEILSGVLWAVSRRPESFLNIPDSKLYLAKTDNFPRHSGFYIWFTFDDEAVYLRSIEEAPSPE